MGENPNRRKVTGIMVDKKAQLRFFVPFAILLVSISMLVVMIHFAVLSTVSNMIQGVQVENPLLINQFNQLMVDLQRIIGIGLTLIGVLTFAFWVHFSHRIFGPKVPLTRHIRAIKEQNYELRTRLRRYDEFKDLADELNQLSEALKQKGGNSANAV